MADALHTASREGNAAAILRQITQEGTKVDQLDRLRRTPLHLASWSGKPEVVKLLISLG